MLLNKAIEIAAKAHAGQVDKGGRPYILHPLRVMLHCEGETGKICAVLHDVIEDTEITPAFLRNEGFGMEILEALDCLTSVTARPTMPLSAACWQTKPRAM